MISRSESRAKLFTLSLYLLMIDHDGTWITGGSSSLRIIRWVTVATLPHTSVADQVLSTTFPGQSRSRFSSVMVTGTNCKAHGSQAVTLGIERSLQMSVSTPEMIGPV